MSNPPIHPTGEAHSLERISLDTIPPVSDDPDHLTEEEDEDLEEEQKRIDLEGKKEDQKQRRSLGKRIFVLVCVWLLAILGLLLLQGFGTNIGFSLPTSVLLATIGSTTVNILGLLFLVTKYHFTKE
jgi:hypothetical protein